MKTQIFRGTGTAIVTPFVADGSTVDYPALENLIELQIAAGVEAIVPLGSTGEGATLDHEEKLSIVDFVVGHVRGRAKVVAGTGTNDTSTTVQLTREIAALGVDAVLIVTPYYNKPTPDGLRRHYGAVADAVATPIILYNVPGRTGSNVLADTTLRLAQEIPSVVGIKEASGNVEQAMEIIRSRPEGFQLMSGEDTLTLPIIASGGDGVIAVISNEVPKLYGDLTRAALAGNFARAREIQYQLLPLMKANFLESNPIPVKAALSMMGLCNEALRLPLTPLSAKHRDTLAGALRAAGALA